VLEADQVLPHLETEEQGPHEGHATPGSEQLVSPEASTVTFFMLVVLNSLKPNQTQILLETKGPVSLLNSLRLLWSTHVGVALFDELTARGKRELLGYLKARFSL
jgi:hypothetical protein